MGLLVNASNLMHRPPDVRGGMSCADQNSNVEEDEEDGAEEDSVPRRRLWLSPAPFLAEGLFESFAQTAPQLVAEGSLRTSS